MTFTTAFTISSNNYLGMTRVFAESFLQHHPEATVFVCIVDKPDQRVPYKKLPFEIVFADELQIPNFRNFAFKYNILELNTAVKPFFFKFLRDQKNLDRAFYFDPDILIHDRLRGLDDELKRCQAVLTPHLTVPSDNLRRPPERVIGMCGVYNLGFLGLKLDSSTRGFVDWWCDRLYHHCVVDIAKGLFVDQSWMNFAPAFLDSVAVVRDDIYNVAYWNLPHRFPYQVGDHWEIDGRRVGFFHFSGVNLDRLDVVSRHQDRIDLWGRPELRPLFQQYRNLVNRSGQGGYSSIPYRYGHFSREQVEIPWFCRTALREVDPRGLRWPEPDRADGSDSFLAWLVEPIVVGGAWIHRASLYLWQERPDIRREFPDLEGGDAQRFVEWYLEGGGEENGLHEVFVKPLIHAQPAPPIPADVLELEAIAELDLADPGPSLSWLNESAADSSGPFLSRLTMAMYKTRQDLQSCYPDPFGADRDGLAYWYAAHARVEYGLHPDLVEPIRKTLSVRSRWTAALRASLGKLGKSTMMTSLQICDPDEPSAAESGGAVEEASESWSWVDQLTVGCSGVNLVGYFEGVRGADNFAPGIKSTLEDADIPVAVVALDHIHPNQLPVDMIANETGAPYSNTILATSHNEWSWARENLPLGTRVGGVFVGVCDCDPRSLPRRSFEDIDEIWIPDCAVVGDVGETIPVPIRRIDFPDSLSRTAFDAGTEVILDPDIFWYLAVVRNGDSVNVAEVESALGGIRGCRMHRERRVGICIATEPSLAGAFQELSDGDEFIEVFLEPLNDVNLRRLLEACDGYLDLQEERMSDPVMRAAVSLGLSVWRSSGIAAREPELGGAGLVNVRTENSVGTKGTDFSAVRLSVMVAVPRSEEVTRAWRDALSGVAGKNARRLGGSGTR